MNRILIFSLLIILISCNSNNKDQIIQELKKENDSLKSKIEADYDNDLTNYLFYVMNKDGRTIGALSKYDEKLPEYDLIVDKNGIKDTLIKKSTDSRMYFNLDKQVFSDSLTKVNLKFRKSGTQFFGIKINVSE
mgnify:FL=1